MKAIGKPYAGKPLPTAVGIDEGVQVKHLWLKYCGTGGKPAGKLRKQTST